MSLKRVFKLEFTSDFSDTSAYHTETHTPDVHGATIDSGQGKFVSASSQYVGYADSEDWNFYDKDFRISTDVTFASLPGYNERQFLFGQYTDSTHIFGCELWWNNIPYRLELKVWIYGVILATNGYISLSWSPTVSTKYNLVIERVGGDLSVYVDTLYIGGYSSLGTMADISAPIEIGRIAFGRYLNGWLDNFMIDKFLLPTSEINTVNGWKEITGYEICVDDGGHVWKPITALEIDNITWKTII